MPLLLRDDPSPKADCEGWRSARPAGCSIRPVRSPWWKLVGAGTKQLPYPTRNSRTNAAKGHYVRRNFHVIIRPRKTAIALAVAFALLVAARLGIAWMDSETKELLEDFTGYILLDVREEHIDGEWEGCDYGETVRFRSGNEVTCEDYFYTYGYSPTVSVISGATFFRSQVLFKCKIIVQDRAHDVGCGRNARVAFERWQRLHLRD